MSTTNKPISGTVTPADDAAAAAKPEKKAFQSRDEVEQKGLFYRGRMVKMTDTIWLGQDTIFLPKWNMDLAYDLGRTITQIIATLFPHDWFFLASIDTTKVATGAARIYHIVYDEIYPQAMEVVQKTLRSTEYKDAEYHVSMDDEEWSKLKRALSPLDFLELFVSVVEQEINNEVMQALSKKVQRLLGERFALENAFPSISETMEEVSTSLLEQLRSSNLQSSTNTQQ